MKMKLLAGAFGLTISASVLAQAAIDPSLNKAVAESTGAAGNAQTAGRIRRPAVENSLSAPESRDSARLQSDRGLPPADHVKKPAKQVKKASSGKKVHKKATLKAKKHKHKKKQLKTKRAG